MRYTQTRFVSDGSYATYKEDLDFRGNVGFADHRLGPQLEQRRAGHRAQLGLLGYELAQVSIGTLTRGVVPGSDASTLALEGNGHEVRVGDRLIPVEAQPYDLQFFPHVPKMLQPEGKLQFAAVAEP